MKKSFFKQLRDELFPGTLKYRTSDGAVFDNAESAVRHAVANKLRIKSFYSEKEL
jgi:hypothetical protein